MDTGDSACVKTFPISNLFCKNVTYRIPLNHCICGQQVLFSLVRGEIMGGDMVGCVVGVHVANEGE